MKQQRRAGLYVAVLANGLGAAVNLILAWGAVTPWRWLATTGFGACLVGAAIALLTTMRGETGRMVGTSRRWVIFLFSLGIVCWIGAIVVRP